MELVGKTLIVAVAKFESATPSFALYVNAVSPTKSVTGVKSNVPSEFSVID